MNTQFCEGFETYSPLFCDMAGTLGVTELAILAFIGMLFFGSQRIPALFRSMGRAKGEFQQGLREGLVGPSETERDLDRGGMTESHAEE